MNFRDYVLADVERWPPHLRAVWDELVATNCFHEWARYPKAEVELRAWVETRAGEVAREPVVLNRHHLTPPAPQAAGSKAWPRHTLYVGRAPITAKPLDQAEGLPWRYAHLLGNKYAKDDYPDALDRYRRDLRAALLADKVKPHSVADAIRDLAPTAALVCSCVSSPWTPEVVIPPHAPTPREVTCHAHVIVMAWRALRARSRTRTASADIAGAPAAG